MVRFWNNIKTAALLGGMFGLILLAGLPFGRGGLMIALILGGAMNVIGYFFSDRIALAAMRGRQVDERSAPDLIAMVKRLANRAGLPMPKVYICPQQAPNAFATGRNPRNAAVAVTHGAMQLLDFDELEGVIAHELAHIKNRDTLISCIAATIAGALQYLAWMAFWIGGSSREGGNPLLMLPMLLLAPIAAVIIQLAISRSREFVADADGAAIAGTPRGLINALRKLHAINRQVPLDGELPSANHMFIVQPLSGRGGGLISLFSTHPPVEQRIASLQRLA
ncbi:MAG: M48 family metalloprotease [Phycisphaeraceae bacterium]|nr:M48 family metalloprotease [Phycisphaeraceae bacterium]